ncbi:MAG: hypothetical protein L3J18_13480 [Candidatus Brocadia sp.]|jgi:hypothetical protein|nr:MAG: hypothetical protein B6D35_02385 [Candidatus Brocadia sp. UTAMX2]UJS19901.1 MAG: hypothetical protein L3J18_13480 [Candidatus Brocadia sp.]
MKRNNLLVLLAIVISLTGCAPIFNDNFEADVIGDPPAVSPAGNPTDDSLNIQGPPNSITVINSIPLGSKSVKIDRAAKPPQVVLECVTGGGPHTTGNYLISYKAYSILADAVPNLTTSVKSSGGQHAFQLRLTDGNYRLASGGNPDEILPGGYAANVVHSISVRINMDTQRFWLNVDGTDVASEKTFLEAGFADVHLLRFEYPEPILEALPGTYVVDNIIIRK